MFDNKNIFTIQTDGTITQDITGDEDSTSYIDFDKADIQITSGKAWLIVKVIAAFNTLTSLEVILETDTDAAFATALKQILTFHFALGKLTAGALLINIPLPAGIYDRYMQMHFNVVGSSPSTGSILAAISDGPEPAEANLDNIAL